MKKGYIISIGSINKDIQVKAERWPEKGETLLVTDLITLGGGKAANRAFLASKFGAPSYLFGRIGDDKEADEVIHSLNEVGVNFEHVKKVKGKRTGLSIIIVRKDGNKTILLSLNANECWGKEGLDETEEVLNNSPQGSVLTIDLEAPEEIVERALEVAHKAEIKVVLDPSPADRFKNGYYKFIDFITPNTAEAKLITGVEIKNKEDAIYACKKMIQNGAKNALVKMGEKGYAMIFDEKEETIPAPRVQVIDTTGAGDAFSGGLAFSLWHGDNNLRAIKFAATASAIAVEKYGSQTAYPDLTAVEEKMNQTYFRS